MDRGLNFINQYDTAKIPPLTLGGTLSVERISHVWSQGDRLWKLSSQYYGDPKYWWLIAWFNRKPTENHFSLGEVITIPTPFESAYSLYSRGS